jgi:hypothetical protein
MLKRSATLALLASTALFFTAAAIPAHAQKPALTENVEEKGRVPYYDSNNSSTCSSSIDVCTISFKPVPAGFRLVITHASGFFVVGSGISPLYASISGGSLGQGGLGQFGPSNYAEYLPTPTFSGQVWYTFSSPLTFYVEPTHTPQIEIGHVQQLESYATISGYLVSIP